MTTPSSRADDREMEIERWLPIAGDDRLEVSDLGRIRIAKTGHIISGTPNYGGYLRVRARGRTLTVHSLVLEMFVGPRPEKYEGAHLNGIRTDNRLCNLAWASHAENEEMREAHGKKPRGTKCYNSVLDERQVKAIRYLRSQGVTMQDLADAFGVSPRLIDKVAKKEAWTHVA